MLVNVKLQNIWMWTWMESLFWKSKFCMKWFGWWNKSLRILSDKIPLQLHFATDSLFPKLTQYNTSLFISCCISTQRWKPQKVVKWVLQETCRNLFHHWSIWGSLCVYEYANVSIILLWHYFILTYRAAKNTVQSCDNTAAFEKIFTIELNVHMLVYTALFSRKDVTCSW